MAPAGTDTQLNLAMLAVVRPPFEIPEDVLPKMTATGALRYAVQRDGRDDMEIADELGISRGYLSKVLKGTAGLHGRRLVKFMTLTHSVAPLQWLAEQMGYELRPINHERRAARRALAEAQQKLERAA